MRKKLFAQIKFLRLKVKKVLFKFCTWTKPDIHSATLFVEFKIQLRWFGALASKFQQVLKINPKFSFSLS